MPTSTEHSSLVGNNIHEAFHYVQASDPGGVGADKYWLDTSANPYILKRRNSANSAWVTVGASGGGAGTDTTAIHDNESGEISAITEKTTLVGDDLFLIEDSAASNAKKKVKKSNIGKVLIAESTPSGTGTVTFSSIPGGHKKLILEFAIRSTQAANAVNGLLEFNSDTTDANYRYSEMHRNGGGFGSASAAVRQFAPSAISAASAPTNGFAIGVIEIPQYDNTNFWKIALCEFANPYDATTVFVQHNSVGYRWSNTAAITSIDVKLSAGNYVSGSVLRLYYED